MSWGKAKIDRADKLFSLYVRTKANWSCERCGKQYQPPTSALHCSHFKGRAKESTRFMLENANAICFGCHRYFTSQPDEHYAWQIETKGQKIVDQVILTGSLYKKKDRKLEAMYWKQRLLEDFGIKG